MVESHLQAFLVFPTGSPAGALLPSRSRLENMFADVQEAGQNVPSSHQQLENGCSNSGHTSGKDASAQAHSQCQDEYQMDARQDTGGNPQRTAIDPSQGACYDHGSRAGSVITCCLVCRQQILLSGSHTNSVLNILPSFMRIEL